MDASITGTPPAIHRTRGEAAPGVLNGKRGGAGCFSPETRYSGFSAGRRDSPPIVTPGLCAPRSGADGG